MPTASLPSKSLTTVVRGGGEGTRGGACRGIAGTVEPSADEKVAENKGGACGGSISGLELGSEADENAGKLVPNGAKAESVTGRDGPTRSALAASTPSPSGGVMVAKAGLNGTGGGVTICEAGGVTPLAFAADDGDDDCADGGLAFADGGLAAPCTRPSFALLVDSTPAAVHGCVAVGLNAPCSSPPSPAPRIDGAPSSGTLVDGADAGQDCSGGALD